MDLPAGVTQEEGHTELFIHLPYAVLAFMFLARRVQSFLSLVDREVEFLCANVIEVASKCIGSNDYWESLTNRIHGSFSSRSTMRVLVDP